MKTDQSAWRTYRQTRDPAVRDQLVEKHLVLVKYAAVRIAGRLPHHLGVDDLYSAGLVGFLAAIEDFDPDRGVEFAAYATRRIRGAIFDELRRLDWVPRAVRRKVREAERAMDVLGTRLGRQPSDDEIAKELGIGVEEYHRILSDGMAVLSLDAAPPGDDAATPLETLEDSRSPNPLVSLAAKERREILARLIETLPDKERQVLSLYYAEELTMQEVGDVLGVTESRVSQLHSSAILRLRAALRRHRLRPADLVVTGIGAREGRR
jgi:RNA polymerase sigma factor for flagellar operon FliA